MSTKYALFLYSLYSLYLKTESNPDVHNQEKRQTIAVYLQNRVLLGHKKEQSIVGKCHKHETLAGGRLNAIRPLVACCIVGLSIFCHRDY